jgi:aminoglycoside phosphotransferase (APT) family kinase protein
MRQRWQRALPEIIPTPAEAARLIRPVLPSAQVLDCTALSGGLANSNIRLALADAAPLVLRFYQRDPTAAPREAAIARRVGMAPRLLHVGDDHRHGPYAVVEWIAGRRLETLSSPAQAALADGLGRTLAGIHAQRFPATGFFAADLTIARPIPVGGDGLIGYLRHCLVDGRGGGRLGPELTAALLAFAAGHAGLLDRWGGPPVLTHSDFNVLVDDGRIAAVLDWEFAFAGSPFFDFGNILRPPFGDQPGVAAGLAAGYRAAGGTLPDNWLALSRLVDLMAWADFLNRPAADETLVTDARAMIVLIMQQVGS